MARVVRQSKYRHVHGESARAEDTYSYLRISTTQGEHFYIKGNTKFFAVPYDTGGGSLCVIPYSQTGRQAPSLPCFTGHRGPVMDFDFNPFHEYLIASGSDDTTVKVWGIPENGLTEHIEDPLVDLTGHGRKVTLIDFHPTANNILASASMDATVKIWDIEKGSEVLTLDSHPENIQHQAWKQDGTVLATSCKDKVVRIFDPRGNATVGVNIFLPCIYIMFVLIFFPLSPLQNSGNNCS